MQGEIKEAWKMPKNSQEGKKHEKMGLLQASITSQSFRVGPIPASTEQLLGPQIRQHLQQEGLCSASAHEGKLFSLFSLLVNSSALSSG